MRVLKIDKFYDVTLPAAGGVGKTISVFSRRLSQIGHEVLRFGCRLGPEPGEMPPFVDYTKSSNLPDKIRGAFRILHDFRAARALDAFLSTHSVDVAHVYNLYHHLTPSVLSVLKRRGIPTVVSVSDFRLMCGVKHFLRSGRSCTRCLLHRYWNCVLNNCAGEWGGSLAVAFETFFQRFFRRYISQVDRFLCPSEFMADVLLADSVPRNKVSVLRNPIELPPDHYSDDGQGVLYVGRLSEEKGAAMMLDIAAALPDVTVSIVGDGPAAEVLRKDAEQRGLKNVRFAGHVSQEQLEEHYVQAAVVVVPSRCFENSPSSMLEAMMRGRCVVGPSHGAFVEWIDDGLTGMLFRPGDGKDLVGVVAKALEDPALRREIGRRASELVRRRHDVDRIVKTLAGFYEEAICRCESQW